MSSRVLGNSLVKDSAYEPDGSYKYLRGNLIEAKGRNGISTSYLWNNENTFPLVKAVGVGYDSLLLAYNSVNGNLDLIRAHSILENLPITTFDYLPILGIKSIIDPNKRKLIYEYDDFFRLVLIRDHDNNIVQKICYNYAGQPEDCSIPCSYTLPDWQNTTKTRCQSGSNGNTGYIEQEQIDLNPCSSTYNQYQWIQTIFDTVTCPLPNFVATTSTNSTNLQGYTAAYTNVSTSQVYTFNISASGGLQPLGNLPPGTYHLTISTNAGGTLPYLSFDSGCGGKTVDGTSATFYSLTVSSSQCYSISISPSN